MSRGRAELCRETRHPHLHFVMSRDIVHTCPGTSFTRSSHPQRLIAAVRIEDELAEQVTAFGHDPNVQAGHEHHDAYAGVPTTNLDVVQPAVVTEETCPVS